MPVYRRKTDPENVTTTIAPEPNARTKMVEAQNLDDLLEQVRGFGAEYGKACDILMKCLAPRGFQRTPHILRCNYENMPEPPDNR